MSSRRFDVEGEVLAEEDATGAVAGEQVRAVEPYREPATPAVRTEVRSAALAAAGGAIAGVVTVAAVRAIGGAEMGSRGRRSRRLSRRRADRPANVVASRSFLVDVHLLGR